MTNEEILVDFKEESKSLLNDMIDILENVETDMSQAQRLSDVSIFVDRIMGGARSIALDFHQDHIIHKIGDYAELCKAVGAKASKIDDNQDFYNICVAFLFDAVEMIETMFEAMDEDGDTDIREIVSDTFKDRLAWIKSQFDRREDNQAAASEATPIQGDKMGQSEIDDLMAKLGLG